LRKPIAQRAQTGEQRLAREEAVNRTFRYKDYRVGGPDRSKLMTLAASEFMRRFLIHVLPTGFHRIRHYGLFANAARAANLAKARALLEATSSAPLPVDSNDNDDTAQADGLPCPCCGGRMFLIEIFGRGASPRTMRAPRVIGIDSS
jgi:hypothetical protein